MSECRYNCKNYDWFVGACNGECDIEKHYSLGYQQGRADAIDFILKNTSLDCDDYSFVKFCNMDCKKVLLEQLKEQKNE